MKSAFWKLEWHVQFWQTHKSDKFTLKYNQSCIVIAKSSLRFFVTGKVQAVFKATLIKKKSTHSSFDIYKTTKLLYKNT